ncbi:MAG: FtsW/RodA/SpoVE family cell cycle protein [Bacteroidetes bacterium]|jgi:cell division protein FtsW|nr:FtsW/RodA/SpoVE family cell cycle protein [Bacteroidota bacterium]MBT3423617.1 FtsW/RodA/SpoVE family cell cycle protein [Bacteroidota bacterium]MBT3800998.1 FtsW/RodA/SpoVE family cell cycle protein [Bacteroidota bacterium]MBT3933383.1 FtsW/RodA/SpoVE family cell cycle protein [Bacteroidota bacterium]MBT4338499.1 FtsW/RodA/SpoVE family cell cycle protein [Bacteroidota bacterium]
MNWLLSRIKGDIHIWLVVFLLTIISVIMVYSSSASLGYAKRAGNMEYYLFRQIAFILIGLLFMYGTHLVNYIYFSRIAQILLFLSFPLLLLTYLFGPDINEAKRWLMVPGTNLTFQTSDLAKLALIMYLARMLSKKQNVIKDFKKGFLPMGAAVLGICAFIAPSDLSTATLLFVSSLLMLFIGRVSFKHISLFVVTILVIGALSIFLALKLGSPGRVSTWQARIDSYVNEGGESYQAIQSKIAIANGEIFGKGPGSSVQKSFLPNPFSDFIFAIIIEEWGFIGGLFVIFLYLWLLFRTIRIVINSPNAFGALLSVGLSMSLVLQAFINMGVASSLLPVTGLTLPMISMGGTSVVFTSVSLGIILSVSRHIEENNDIDNQFETT